MTRILLDTNVCIAILRGTGGRVVRRMRRYAIDAIGVSTITFAELQFGAAKSSDPRANAIAVAKLLAPLGVLSFDSRAAMEYGELRAALERAGTPIGPLDTLIAAHALAIGARLVTANLREFARVPNLRTENWLE